MIPFKKLTDQLCLVFRAAKIVFHIISFCARAPHLSHSYFHHAPIFRQGLDALTLFSATSHEIAMFAVNKHTFGNRMPVSGWLRK